MTSSIHRLKARSLRDAARSNVPFAKEFVATCFSSHEHTDLEDPEKVTCYAFPSDQLREAASTELLREHTGLELSDIGLAFWPDGEVTVDVDQALASAFKELAGQGV
jgi:hypothetical protein